MRIGGLYPAGEGKGAVGPLFPAGTGAMEGGCDPSVDTHRHPISSLHLQVSMIAALHKQATAFSMCQGERNLKTYILGSDSVLSTSSTLSLWG